jgi:hypothetical protein
MSPRLTLPIWRWRGRLGVGVVIGVTKGDPITAAELQVRRRQTTTQWRAHMYSLVFSWIPKIFVKKFYTYSVYTYLYMRKTKILRYTGK